MSDAYQLPALREVGEDGLLEGASLVHEESPEVERLVVARKVVIAQEAVDHGVLVEPVEEQIIAAPVARFPRGDPVEPLEVGMRVVRQTVVAKDDGIAADGDG
jgi:hypothetical protein